MRLLLRLRSKNDQKDVSLEYHKLQGFVYSLLQESGFPLLHDKPGYKPFCFSNIFPFGDMKEGDVRHFMIASPGKTIIEHLAQHLTTNHTEREIHIGDCAFALDGVRMVETPLGNGAGQDHLCDADPPAYPGVQLRSLCGARRGTQAPVSVLAPADLV